MYPRCGGDRAVGRFSKTGEHRNFRGDFVCKREHAKHGIRLQLGEELVESGRKAEPAFARQNRNFEQGECAHGQRFTL